MKPEIDFDEEIKKYKHKFSGRIEFSQVDSFGVLHNIQYFYLLEWARTDYLRTIGVNVNPRLYISEFPLMTVHSEMDYFNPARFNDEYEVLTRIDYIRKSSLRFENIIRLKSGVIMAKGSGILVNIDPKTGNSEPIPEEIREMIERFEGKKTFN